MEKVLSDDAMFAKVGSVGVEFGPTLAGWEAARTGDYSQGNH